MIDKNGKPVPPDVITGSREIVIPDIGSIVAQHVAKTIESALGGVDDHVRSGNKRASATLTLVVAVVFGMAAFCYHMQSQADRQMQYMLQLHHSVRVLRSVVCAGNSTPACIQYDAITAPTPIQ